MGTSAALNHEHKEKNFLILFDGVCNLCNGSVQFIIKHDTQKKFQFASLQSPIGQRLTKEYSIEGSELYSILLINDGKVYDRSTAVLKIVKELQGAWPLLYAFILVPPFIRNFFYRLVAKNRYRIFGKRDQCMIPTPELRSRFLD